MMPKLFLDKCEEHVQINCRVEIYMLKCTCINHAQKGG